MDKMIYKFFLPILGLFLLIKCSGEGTDKSGEDFYINDQSLLGIEVIDKDLGIKILPPKNWILMPSSLSKKIEARNGMNNNQDNFIYQPVYLFFNDSTGSVLSVGNVLTVDSTLSKYSAINYYKSLLSTKYKNNDLTIGSFTKSNIAFTQFKFKKENLVSIKLIFENSRHEIIQADYSFPQLYANSLDGLIKASVGSIQLD
jgi:hypothetical protein